MQELEGLELNRYIEVALRRWWVILAVPVLAAVLALVWSRSQVPIYEARVVLLFQQAGTTPASPSLGDLQASERQARTYQELITTRPVLEDLAVALNLANDPSSLARKVTATVVRDTRLMRVYVRDRNPQIAADMAATLAEVFIRRLQEDRLTDIARLQAAASARGIFDSGSILSAQLATLGSVSVVDPPVVPNAPVLPKTRTNIFVAAFLGLLLGGLLAFMLEYFNDEIRSPEELEQMLNPSNPSRMSNQITNLGVVPLWKGNGISSHIPAISRPAPDHEGEPYRQIRANLRFAMAPHPEARTVLVTSALAGEGKTTTAVNMALALAQTGLKVVLIDADLRRPDVQSWFDVPDTAGLSNLLVDTTVPFVRVLRTTHYENLNVITSGPIPPNPTELLSIARLRDLLKELRTKVDYIFIDSPPVLPVADTSELMKVADGLVLVVRANRIGRRTLRECLSTIHKAGLPVFGTVVNALKAPRLYPGRYHYYYGYYGGYRNDRNGSRGLLTHIWQAVRGSPKKKRHSRKMAAKTPPAVGEKSAN
jgi:non-specific protein-tyrosine kinase